MIIANEEKSAPIKEGVLWREKFEKIGLRLAGFNRLAEGEFVKVGEKLQSFVDRIQNMSNIALGIGEIVTGNEFIEASINLWKTLDLLTYYAGRSLDDMGACSVGLRKLNLLISDLKIPMENFKESSNMLTAMGISTRIESARLRNQWSSFDSLSEEIKNLARRVEIQSREIISDCDLLENLINESIENVSLVGKSELLHIEEVVNETKEALEKLDLLQDKCSSTAGFIGGWWENIYQKVGEIIVSSQFQDITSQKLERVVNNLRHIGKNLDKAEKEGDEEMMKESALLCKLQHSQICKILREFKEAVRNIKASLGEVAGDINCLAAQANSVCENSNLKGSDLLTKVEDSFKTVISVLNKNLTTCKTIGGLVEQAAEGAFRVSSFITSIEKSSADLEIIALNTRIKSAKTGEKGVGLALISRTVQNLSNDTHLKTSQILEIIDEIVRVAQGVKYQIEDILRIHEMNLDDLRAQISSHLQTLEAKNRRYIDEINQMEREGAVLAEEITKTAQDMDIDELFESEMAEILHFLAEIGSECDIEGDAEEKVIEKGINLPEGVFASTSIDDEDYLNDNVVLF